MRAIGKIVIRPASRHRSKIGLVSQRVIITIEASGQFHEATAGKEDGVVADAQHLLFREGGEVRHVVVEGAHVGGNGRHGIHGDVAGVVLEGAHILRNLRDLRTIGKVAIVSAGRYRCKIGFVGQVVIITAEAVARLVGIEGIRHAQQLLCGPYRVIAAASRINAYIQKENPASPIDCAEITQYDIAFADVQRYQTIGIGSCHMSLCIDGITLWTRAIFQNDHLHSHRCVGQELVIGISHHRLIGKFLWSLCHQTAHRQHHKYN